MPALVQVHLLTRPVSACTAVQFDSKHVLHTENNEMYSMNKSKVQQTTCIVLAQAFDFLHDTLCCEEADFTSKQASH